ncbi:MAG: hypothetical protein KGM47_02835, partial [Acidobacteriota bacterium]|nr:hypothetical protein [Acidobacteriota bacterium]
MTRQTDDRDLLLRYLEGGMNQDETDQMDARLLSDDDFLDRMTEARNDLLDAYAAGKLDGSQKERLEKILRRGSIERGPLGVARALQKVRSAAPGTTPRPLRGWGFLWRTAIAMICAGIVVAIVFYVKNRTNSSSPLMATRRSAHASSPQNKPAASPPSAASAPSGHPAFALLLG